MDIFKDYFLTRKRKKSPYSELGEQHITSREREYPEYKGFKMSFHLLLQKLFCTQPASPD